MYKSSAELRENYVKKNCDADKFLITHERICPMSLIEFKREYYKEYRDETEGKKSRSSLGAKFSERVFAYWLFRELEDVGHQEGVSVHKKVRVTAVTSEKIDYIIDFSFQNKHRNYYIEFKCNIDNIEKDLYKFSRIHDRWREGELGSEEPIKVLFVWEREDNSYKYRSGERRKDAVLLEDAKCTGILDDYFYFPCEKELMATKLESEVARLTKFLGNAV